MRQNLVCVFIEGQYAKTRNRSKRWIIIALSKEFFHNKNLRFELAKDEFYQNDERFKEADLGNITSLENGRYIVDYQVEYTLVFGCWKRESSLKLVITEYMGYLDKDRLKDLEIENEWEFVV